MKIEQDEIDIHLVQSRIRQVWIAGRDDLKCRLSERTLQSPPDGRLIVDHEYTRGLTMRPDETE